MNTNFFIDGRWFTTPCKTVLKADEFVVEFFTDKHSIAAKVSDKCYFLSIDDITLSNIKCDFYFGRNYNNPKEFLSNLYETFVSFVNTFYSVEKCPLWNNIDEVLDRMVETVRATVIKTPESEYTHIDDIKKFKEKADLNSSYGEATEPLTAYQFERLTRTLYKSLFKAIGLTETRKIPFIISNNMVFFNYNGMQYKYYPSQCKIFKKCGKKYQRINWKDFSDDNSPAGQKQAIGRSPPFTPGIRSINIDKIEIKRSNKNE